MEPKASWAIRLWYSPKIRCGKEAPRYNQRIKRRIVGCCDAIWARGYATRLEILNGEDYLHISPVVFVILLYSIEQRTLLVSSNQHHTLHRRRKIISQSISLHRHTTAVPSFTWNDLRGLQPIWVPAHRGMPPAREYWLPVELSTCIGVPEWRTSTCC